MAVVVDRGNLLVDSLIEGFKPVRDILVLAGLFYSSKLAVGTFSSLYKAFKTFVLPLAWPRNLPKEYGAWAVVTGCTKGIGLSYAKELASKGFNLILIARKADLLQTISDEIKVKHKVQVEIIIADFSKGQDIYSSIAEGLAGKEIGILVNNVGVSHGFGYLEHASDQDIWNMIQVNVGGMTMMSKLVLPAMKSRKKGAIVNIASIAGLGPQPYLAQYAATKAYMDFISQGLSYECQDFGITVQCIYPGPVLTDMLTSTFEDQKGPNFLIPTSDAYAASALRTLGFSNGTTGYWSHALLSFTVHRSWLCAKANKNTMEKYSKKS